MLQAQLCTPLGELSRILRTKWKLYKLVCGSVVEAHESVDRIFIIKITPMRVAMRVAMRTLGKYKNHTVTHGCSELSRQSNFGYASVGSNKLCGM